MILYPFRYTVFQETFIQKSIWALVLKRAKFALLAARC